MRVIGGNLLALVCQLNAAPLVKSGRGLIGFERALGSMIEFDLLLNDLQASDR